MSGHVVGGVLALGFPLLCAAVVLIWLAILARGAWAWLRKLARRLRAVLGGAA